MTTPLPLVPPPLSAGRAYQVQVYYTQFLQQDGQAIAAGWLKWASSHPNQDAQTAVQAYADSLAVQGLGNAITNSTVGTGAALGQIGQGTAKGLADLSFHGLNLAAWFVRIGEILAGLVLIGIGLNAMLKGTPFKIVTGPAGAVGRLVP